MPKLPVLSGREVLKIVSKTIEGKKITIPIPLHPELAKGTLKSIMNQAGLKLEDLLKLL